MRSPFAALSLAALVAAPCAFAGARPYAFIEGTESLPQGEAELENWFGLSRASSGSEFWYWWVGPVAGITDRWEAGLFGLFTQPLSPSGTGSLQFHSLRLQITRLLADRGEWPVDVRLRGELGIPAADDSLTAWFDAIASRDFGPLNAQLYASLWAEMPKNGFDADWYLTWGAGVSYRLLDAVRVGAELYDSRELNGALPSETIGPCIAYGSGRFWLSAGIGFGLSPGSPHHRGRLVLGVLL